MSEDELKALFAHPEVDAWRAVTRGYRSMYAHLDKELQQQDMNISRLEILILLLLQGSMRSIDLSKEMVTSRANMSMFLKRLVVDNLVEKEDESARGSYKLTKKGLSTLKKQLPLHLERVRERMPAISQKSLKTLSEL